MTEHNPHPTAKRLQALLDGALSGADARKTRAHLAGCSRCQTEFGRWTELFRDLDRLGHLHVPLGFSTQVLEAWRASAVVEPAAASVPAAAVHPAASALQEFVEGALSREPAEALASHLAACSECSREVESWRAVMARLDELGHVAVPEGFGDRTYRRFRRSRRAGAWRRARSVATTLGRRVVPATRKGWAAVAGVASAPAVVVAAVAWVLVSNPLVTPSALLSFVRWKVADAAGATFGGAFEWLSQSLAGFQAYQLVEFVSGSPLAASAGVLAMSVATVSALWVLYRNLFPSSNPRTTYARASI